MYFKFQHVFPTYLPEVSHFPKTEPAMCYINFCIYFYFTTSFTFGVTFKNIIFFSV